MTLRDALIADPYTLRRAVWPDGMRLREWQQRLWLRCPNPLGEPLLTPYQPTIEDVLADDWEA